MWSMIPSWLELGEQSTPKNKSSLYHRLSRLADRLKSFLENLHIANSKFRGSIPTEIGNLSRLHSLKFAGTETTGIIPTQIGLTSALRLVAAVRIEIEGSLPSEVGMLSMLSKSSICASFVVGFYHTRFTNLIATHTANFELQGTSMRGGTIPSEVGQCSSLGK